MNEAPPDGLILTQGELLALLNATDPPTLVGIDEGKLIPRDEARHRELMEAGVESLVERDILRVQDGTLIMSEELAILLRVISFPVIATIAVKDTPGVGSQSLVYYHAGDVLIEHSMPDADHYRFAVVPSVEAQMERTASLLALDPNGATDPGDATLPQDRFFAARERVNDGDPRAARDLLSADLPRALTEALVEAMADARFSGTVAMVRLNREGDAADARNIAVLQGADSAWLFEQSPPGSERLSVRAATAEDVADRLYGCWEELASPTPA